MRQRDGVISEAIYYVRRPRHLWGPKQQMLYLPSKTKYGSQGKFKSKVDNDK